MQERGAKSSSWILGVLGVAAIVVAGCGGAQTSAGGASGGGSDQIATGAKLYGEKCAGCHGAGGEGGKAPAVVGKTALPLDPPAGAKFRKTQFHTAKDVFDFVKAAMPPNAGGSLSDDDYRAIIAFDLKANGVAMEGKVVDASSLPSFVLH